MHIDNSISGKRFWLLIVVLFTTTPLFAQTVKNESQTINSRKYPGYSTTINDNQEKVSEFWLEELKEVGKIRRKRDFNQIEELTLPDEYHPEAIYYTRVIQRDSSSSRIWIALDPETLLAGENGVENVNIALEKYVSSIQTNYEAYLIQMQIDEAVRVIDFTNRQQQKFLQDNKSLEYQLAESKAERERLLETIQSLELEILATTQKIEDNNMAVKQSNSDLEKINMMLEEHRRSLRKLKE